jgi:hypothetical protein
MLCVLALAGCNNNSGDNKTNCVPGVQQSCACLGGAQGIQVCAADGSHFDACQCSAAQPDLAGTVAPDLASTAAPGDLSMPRDLSVGPDLTDPCAGHIYYAGKYDGATSIWSSLPAAGGLTSLDAGNAQCKALNIGADHVCDYTELVAAQNAGEALFKAIPQGTTGWVQRTTTVSLVGTTPVTTGGTPSAPGPGGNCNNWTYGTNHIADGEYVTFDTVGTPTYHLDNDTIFDPQNPGVHTIPNDLQCGGFMRSILCCYQACM